MISIIIPIFNEEGNIEVLYQRLNNVMKSMQQEYEYIFINDGSIDTSMEIILNLSKNDERIKHIDFSKNFGHQIAVYAGLEHAAGDEIVIIDADLQDPPELIQDLYNKMQEGYDVVYAQREFRQGESYFKKTSAKYFYRILKYLSDTDIPLDTGDFRIMSKRIRNIVINMPEYNKFLRGQIAWAGFKQTGIVYNRESRYDGKSGYPYSKMIKFAFDGLTSFSNTPLKIATYTGFVVSMISFVVLIYTLYVKYFKGSAIQGWTSTMLAILFIGGVQLVCIGIIGEYLGRVLDNVRNRPQYIVKDANISKRPSDQ
jgi:glycosyltransferase involved in cell wall biosynthesis